MHFYMSRRGDKGKNHPFLSTIEVTCVIFLSNICKTFDRISQWMDGLRQKKKRADRVIIRRHRSAVRRQQKRSNQWKDQAFHANQAVVGWLPDNKAKPYKMLRGCSHFHVCRDKNSLEWPHLSCVWKGTEKCRQAHMHKQPAQCTSARGPTFQMHGRCGVHIFSFCFSNKPMLRSLFLIFYFSAQPNAFTIRKQQ